MPEAATLNSTRPYFLDSRSMSKVSWNCFSHKRIKLDVIFWPGRCARYLRLLVPGLGSPEGPENSVLRNQDSQAMFSVDFQTSYLDPLSLG